MATRPVGMVTSREMRRRRGWERREFREEIAKYNACYRVVNAEWDEGRVYLPVPNGS